MFLVTTNKVVTWEVRGTLSNVTYAESMLVENMNKWTTKLHNITFPASITMYFEAFKGILHRTSCLFFFSIGTTVYIEPWHLLLLLNCLPAKIKFWNFA